MKTHSFSRVSQGGFTLAELLTACLIVIVLVVVSIPTIRSITIKNRTQRCADRLRQTGMLLLASMADNQNALYSFIGGSEANEIWTKRLVDRQYLTAQDAAKTLRCPYGPTQYTPLVGSQWYYEAFGLTAYSEELVVTAKEPNTRWITLYPSRISSPSRYILVADSLGPNNYQSFRIMNRFADKSTICMRHGGRANAFFLDGHMEQLDRRRAAELEIADELISEPK